MAAKVQPFSQRQHMQTNTFEIFRYRDPSSQEVPLHHHDFYEIYFFISGKVQYNIEGHSYLLTPGDILLIRPLELHQPLFPARSGGYERIVLWLNQDFLHQFGLADEPLSACFNGEPGRANLLRPDENVRQLLLFYLDQLLQESASSEYGSKVSCLSHLALILSQLCRMSTQEPQEPEPREISNVIYQIWSYINDHYTEDLSLDYLANRFFISKYHLSREFARISGTSVHRFLVQKRLILAKQMMMEGTSSSEVYQHCGFGDYSTFYRAFKAEFQMSPREFSAELKQSATERENRRQLFHAPDI